jgi:hypothetical protein
MFFKLPKNIQKVNIENIPCGRFCWKKSHDETGKLQSWRLHPESLTQVPAFQKGLPLPETSQRIKSPVNSPNLWCIFFGRCDCSEKTSYGSKLP